MIVANKNSGDHQCIAGWEKRKSKEQGKSIFALSPTYEFMEFTLIEFLIRKFYKRGASSRNSKTRSEFCFAPRTVNLRTFII